MTSKLTSRVGRCSIVGALAASTVLSPFGFSAAQAQDISGELVMLNWLAGAQAEMMDDLQADFMEKNPEVTFRNIVPTSSGDTRGGIRTVLLGGEQADLLINTWPAFRQELVDAGMILPVDEALGRERLVRTPRRQLEGPFKHRRHQLRCDLHLRRPFGALVQHRHHGSRRHHPA